MGRGFLFCAILIGVMVRLVMGIDEAGRGCVIGPLFLAAFLISEEDHLIDRLNDWGVRDSKLLLSHRRDLLAGQLKKLAVGYKVARIPPRLLDRFSLNELEAKFSAELINRFNPHRVYLDAPASGRGIRNYCSSVASLCSAPPRLVGANKMDDTNVLVAAASILAKSAREQHIRTLKKKFGDFGSGYPSDPKTTKWLAGWKRSHGDWPGVVRRKWQTLLKLK